MLVVSSCHLTHKSLKIIASSSTLIIEIVENNSRPVQDHASIVQPHLAEGAADRTVEQQIAAVELAAELDEWLGVLLVR